MRKKRRSILSGILMVVLMISTVLALPAATYAEEVEQKAIKLVSATTDSITLEAEDGYVYAIKGKDSVDPNKYVWIWAGEKQYDKTVTPKTVKFTGLKAGSEYEFARAAEATETPVETGKAATAPLETQPVSTEPASTEPVSTEPASTEPASTEPASTEPVNAEPMNVLPAGTEQVNGPTLYAAAPKAVLQNSINGNTSDKIEVAVNVGGNAVGCVFTCNEYDTAKNEWKYLRSNEDGKFQNLKPDTKYQITAHIKAGTYADGALVYDADGPESDPLEIWTIPTTATGTLKTTEITDTKVVLDLSQVTFFNPENTIECGILDGKGGVTWQPALAFEGLNPATTYQFVVREVSKGSGLSMEALVTEFTTLKSYTGQLPDAPEAQLVDKNQIQLKVVSGQQYAMLADGQPGEWNETGIFDNLDPATEYSFVTRIKSSGDVGPSGPSAAFAVSTKALPAPAPGIPELDSKTDVMVQLKVVSGQEYAMMVHGEPGEWNETGTFNNLTPGTEYDFVTRKKVEGEADISEPLKLKTKTVAAQAPAAPELEGRQETSITLKAVENQEYGIVKADGSVAWQSTAEFTGLTANTEYGFKTRMAFNADEAMESQASAESKFKTVIPFAGSTITGIADNGSYVSGSSLTAKAVGNGMDNAKPAVGDTRWVPMNWNWGQATFADWKDDYTIPFTVSQVGNYRLTVKFRAEEYTAEGWKAMDMTNSTSIRFAITEAQAQNQVNRFTLTSKAGTNGRINPSGTVTVDSGRDYEFTFIPDNGYVVAKVYVDGVEVKVTNNKYSFTNITANHSISVTFEQAKKISSPRTGDGSPVTPVMTIMILSVLVLAGLVVFSRKKEHE
ncbi:MAG: hypothetical protein EOM34_15480 [Clostridia bacterium]|nr:hypothetical protein [Lachnospiraceae bacterium]NCC02042.1 hypothetical protein [Clostridia bacterium]